MQSITPDWPAPAHIKAYTTTRNGGVSEGAYNSFNLAHHVNDNPEHVQKNREILVNDFDLPEMPTWIDQVHGVDVLSLEPPFDPGSCPSNLAGTDLQYDAVFTTTPNNVCAVMTADCLPLLISNKAGTAVAAVHAGWKGLAAGVIDAAIATFLSRPSPKDASQDQIDTRPHDRNDAQQPFDLRHFATQNSETDLLIYLGPALSKEHFAVGEEVINAFTERLPAFANGFEQRDRQWYGNLYELARINLQALGIPATNIYGGNYCTYSDSELFYSYRRDNGVTGRMCSLIWIE